MRLMPTAESARLEQEGRATAGASLSAASGTAAACPVPVHEAPSTGTKSFYAGGLSDAGALTCSLTFWATCSTLDVIC